MDKRQLNQEIILCRALVKRARVCVVRKLLKQIKILRSCKNEEYREKKFRKARRLVAEIHVMKTLRPDYVTKFALVTENYVSTGSNTKLKRKKNACAKIAKYKDLVAKINAIRNKFVNWREEISPMLESARKKKSGEAIIDDSKIDKGPIADESEQCNSESSTGTSDATEDKCDGFGEHPVKKKSDEKSTEPGNKSEVPKPKINKSIDSLPTTSLKSDKVKTLLNADEEQKEIPERKIVESPVKDRSRSIEKDENGAAEEEKIEDPFFIGKRIIVPKLLQKVNENHPDNENARKSTWNEDWEQELRPKKKRDMTEEEQEDRISRKKRVENAEPRKRQLLTEDELHPSWKAKKMQTIKPFQGKIIKFE